MINYEKATCDAANDDGIKINCKNIVEFVCLCSRCNRETPDRFFSCAEHVKNVAYKHFRIYGRSTMFKRIPIKEEFATSGDIVMPFKASAKYVFHEPTKNDWGGAKQW